MTHEHRFRQIIRGLLAIGVKPTPTTLNRFLGRMHRASTNDINGRETAWRREEFLAAGWLEPMHFFDQHYNQTHRGRWTPPL